MLRRSFFFIAAIGVAACAKDVVPADTETESDCGNGVLEDGEECDLDSPGCQSCVVVPEWRCDANGCSQICGDGVVGSGSDCESPRRDATCDLTGYWAIRETDFTHDQVLNALQTSSTWYLLRIAQTGDKFTVTEEIECGIHVTGGATVDDTPGALRAQAWANRMDGGGDRGARGGSSVASGNGCMVTLDRWYMVRGVDPSYLPADFATKPALATLPPLPAVDDPVTSTAWPQGAVDEDGDGVPGIAYAINAGFFTGYRNSAQRDYNEYASTSPVDAGALTFAIPGAYDLQENVLRITGCGDGCALLASPAFVATDATPRVTFAFIGKTPGSDRVSRVVVRAPRQDIDDDLTTCAHVRAMLPHDTSP